MNAKDTIISRCASGMSRAVYEWLAHVIEPQEMAEFIELMLGPEMQCLRGSVLWADCGADAAVRPDRF